MEEKAPLLIAFSQVRSRREPEVQDETDPW